MSKNEPKQIVEGPGDYHDAEEGMMVEASGSELVASAEIDMQIATARRYPRNLTDFRRTLTELVTIDESVARSCIYVVPRDGKNIEGPSARFAELLVSCWGNNRTGGRILGADNDFVTGQGFFFDLEKNTAITYEVKTSITKRNGDRFSQDMIGVAGSSAASKAHRNAALKGIPKALWLYAYEKAKAVVAGDQKTLSSRRVDMLKDIMAQGATKEQIFGVIGVKGIDDVTLEHMVILGGIHTAIKESGTSVEEAFSIDKMKNPGEVAPNAPTRSSFAGADKGGKKAAEAKPAAKPTEDKVETKAAAEVEDHDPETGEVKDDVPDEREADRLEFVADYYKSLAVQTSVPKIVALREEAIEAGVMTDAETKKWTADCQTKYDEVFNAAKAARKAK